jgi:hypothetical protein
LGSLLHKQEYTSFYRLAAHIVPKSVYSANDILRKMREKPIGEAAGEQIRTTQGAMIPLTAPLSDDPGAGGDARYRTYRRTFRLHNTIRCNLVPTDR